MTTTFDAKGFEFEIGQYTIEHNHWGKNKGGMIDEPWPIGMIIVHIKSIVLKNWEEFDPDYFVDLLPGMMIENLNLDEKIDGHSIIIKKQSCDLVDFFVVGKDLEIKTHIVYENDIWEE
jgi:hypothetical protein